MEPHRRAIKFSLAKTRAMLDVIASAKEIEFPYDDPKEAIQFISEQFEDHLSYLKTIDAEPSFDPATAKNFCKRLLDEIDQYLLAIGFVQRACDTSSPFELHSPLAQLTRKTLRNSPRLVISLDWNFSPFTLIYPNQFGDKFVFVGLPASEISNPLVFPLAGHELGHNVWRYQRKLQLSVGQKLKDHIERLVKTQYKEAVALIFQPQSAEQLDQHDLFEMPWDIAHTWAVAQTEEVFCDLVGLFLFGASYLYAFEYLLSPGGGLRNPLYPGMKARVQHLADVARKYDIDIDVDYETRFEESEVTSDPRNQLLLALSDSATRSLVLDLAAAVHTFCVSKGVKFSASIAERNTIEAAFKDFVPALQAPSIAAILGAGWNLYISEDAIWPFENNSGIDHAKRLSLLRELMLKSLEVFQLEQLGFGKIN